MKMMLELVLLPVTDIERAKDFYMNKVGFALDVDVQPAEGVRFVQLTPVGSACSIAMGTGLTGLSRMPPGSIEGLHLVVADVQKAGELLASKGVEVGEVLDVGDGVKYVGFSDPDGNSWVFQEMPWRAADFAE